MSVAARDQPLSLQRPHHDRDRRTLHAEHDREKFLFQRELVGVDAIVRLEQPPAAPLLHVVQRVARRALHDLQQVGLRVKATTSRNGPGVGALLDETSTGIDGNGPLATCWNVRPSPARSPRNTPIPSMPSRPTVATSTSAPSRISFVTENTPPFGKYTLLTRARWPAAFAGGHGVHAQVLLDALVVRARQSREQPIVQRRAVGQATYRSWLRLAWRLL